MKRTFFSGLIMMMVMAVAGCGNLTESSHQADGKEFLGVWERTGTECPACDKLVIRKKEEGEIVIDKLHTYKLEFPHTKKSYTASYGPDDNTLTIHTELRDAKAGLDNGQLVVSGKTYHQVSQ